MSDDTLGIIIGVGVVIFVYAIVHLVIKKTKGKVGWKPDWITPLVIILLGFLTTLVLAGVYDSGAMMVPILISFGAIPILLGIVLIKCFFVYVLKKEF